MTVGSVETYGPLIRKILMEIEKTLDGARLAQVKIENYPREQIQYHLALSDEAGLIIAKDASSDSSLSLMPIRLTWEGHEFLDNARNVQYGIKHCTTKEKLLKALLFPF